MATSTKDDSRRRKKVVEKTVASNDEWTIDYGTLEPMSKKYDEDARHLTAVGEKIPREFLDKVMNELDSQEIRRKGVYIIHDSMGYPRYVGRGSLRSRIQGHFRSKNQELQYFSFFIMEDDVHEREVETIMIRAAGPLLHFNSQKVRIDIQAGSVTDFEPVILPH